MDHGYFTHTFYFGTWTDMHILCLLYRDYDKDSVFAHLSTDCPCEVEQRKLREEKEQVVRTQTAQKERAKGTDGAMERTKK